MRKINLNELIWLLILVSLDLYLYYILSTGLIYRFIHPRMLVYSILTFVCLLVLSIFQIRMIFKKREGKLLKPGYIVFIFTIITTLTVNPEGITEETIINKKFLNTNTECLESHSPLTDKNSKNMNFMNVGVIKIDNTSFNDALNEIYRNPVRYKGRKVDITGFPIILENSENDEFIVARILISCCAADARVVGMKCRVGKGTVAGKEKWIRVSGKIDLTIEFNAESGEKEIFPIITTDSIQTAVKPKNSYVYP